MTVIFEALAAREGDALLVRFGNKGHPKLWLIDAGPAGVYKDAVKPRLNQVRADADLDDDEPLDIDLVMVSHVDADHVRGVLDLFTEMRSAHDAGRPLPYRIHRTWHNSFDLADSDASASALQTSAEQAVATLQGVDDELDTRVASIGQGRRLADLVHFFDLAGNPPFDGLVIGPQELADQVDGATVIVIGPTRTQLDDLADKWEKEVGEAIDRGDLAEAAAYVDKSVSNLSSIALHVRIGRRTMLLTGDARGDYLLEGLTEAGLRDSNDRCHVDLLKIPHHGSDRNLDEDFFKAVTADHYVISADGKHDNPSPSVLDWIVDTQGDRAYTIYLTYGDAMGAETRLLDRRTGNRRYKVVAREPHALSVPVEL